MKLKKSKSDFNLENIICDEMGRNSLSCLLFVLSIILCKLCDDDSKINPLYHLLFSLIVSMMFYMGMKIGMIAGKGVTKKKLRKQLSKTKSRKNARNSHKKVPEVPGISEFSNRTQRARQFPQPYKESTESVNHSQCFQCPHHSQHPQHPQNVPNNSNVSEVGFTLSDAMTVLNFVSNVPNNIPREVKDFFVNGILGVKNVPEQPEKVEQAGQEGQSENVSQQVPSPSIPPPAPVPQQVPSTSSQSTVNNSGTLSLESILPPGIMSNLSTGLTLLNALTGKTTSSSSTSPPVSILPISSTPLISPEIGNENTTENATENAPNNFSEKLTIERLSCECKSCKIIKGFMILECIEKDLSSEKLEDIISWRQSCKCIICSNIRYLARIPCVKNVSRTNVNVKSDPSPSSVPFPVHSSEEITLNIPTDELKELFPSIINKAEDFF